MVVTWYYVFSLVEDLTGVYYASKFKVRINQPAGAHLQSSFTDACAFYLHIDVGSFMFTASSLEQTRIISLRQQDIVTKRSRRGCVRSCVSNRLGDLFEYELLLAWNTIRIPTLCGAFVPQLKDHRFLSPWAVLDIWGSCAYHRLIMKVFFFISNWNALKVISLIQN